ncbi:uncharacterized protein LOC124133632 [Haliotis rufescens]|uniref:uncharacterized protein LOC124133632 n=1 Tax=Haliotis rufescens TaxID=6454 RepID=UPI00201EB2DC|nr:uncharacterized protein LOC124133632 [Haliotis rufescens]
MPHWGEKCRTYRLGVVCTSLGFLGYILAFSLPTWSHVFVPAGDIDTVEYDQGEYVNGGLWLHSCEGWSSCRPFNVTQQTVLFHSARSLASAALLLAVISLVLIPLYNFTGYSRFLKNETELVSVFPLISGLFGAAACIVYIFCQEIKFLYWGVGVGCAGSAMAIYGGMFMLAGLRNDKQCRRTRRTRRRRNNSTDNFSAVHQCTAMDENSVVAPFTYLRPAGSQTSVLVSRPDQTPQYAVPYHHSNTSSDQEPSVHATAPPLIDHVPQASRFADQY